MRGETLEHKLCKLYLTITRFFISLTKVGTYWPGTYVKSNDVYYVITKTNKYDKFGQIFTLQRVVKPKLSIINVPIYARITEIEKVMTFKNLWHDATYWWGWYRRNWLWLDTRAMERGQILASIETLGRNRALGRK